MTLAAAGAGAGVPLRELALLTLVSAAVSYLLTGVVRWAIIRSGRLDAPRTRDVHDMPKPSLGGVAMFTGALTAIWLASELPALTRGFPPSTGDMPAVVVAAFFLLITGVLDDLFDLDALAKLLGQVASALAMSVMGLTWYIIYVPGVGTVILDPVLSTVLTVVFTVALINALNFVDGIDGLAAGLGMIAAAALLVYSMIMLYDQGGAVSAYPPAMISAVLLGACAGFLPHNFEPARIFMGDSGAMFIGLMLAAASTSASGRISPSMYGTADVFALMAPVIIVVAALSVPLLDLFMAVVRRTSQGRSPFSPDKRHLHHRLLAMGHSHRDVVLVLYMWLSVVAYGAVGTTMFPLPFVAVTFGLALIAAAVVTFGPTRRLLSRRYGDERREAARDGWRRRGLVRADRIAGPGRHAGRNRRAAGADARGTGAGDPGRGSGGDPRRGRGAARRYDPRT